MLRKIQNSKIVHHVSQINNDKKGQFLQLYMLDPLTSWLLKLKMYLNAFLGKGVLDVEDQQVRTVRILAGQLVLSVKVGRFAPIKSFRPWKYL